MKKSKNMLEMVPLKNPKINWKIKHNKVVLTKTRNKPIDYFMNKVFKTALESHTELEELGSFIWQQCDGIQNIYTISKRLESHFGEKAHPVLDRLVVYMKTLSDNGFILLK